MMFVALLGLWGTCNWKRKKEREKEKGRDKERK